MVHSTSYIYCISISHSRSLYHSLSLSPSLSLSAAPDCHEVSLSASSPSLELLAKCDFDSFSSLALPLASPEQDQLRMLAQVSVLHL